MLTQSSPLPEHRHIAGLVDATIALERDAEGGLSLQVTLGPAGPGQQRTSPLLEIGLSDDATRDLSHYLLSDDNQPLQLRCHVGVRARET